MRPDSTQTRHTGIALYVHQSIAMITHRRTDLKSERVECVWVEIMILNHHLCWQGIFIEIQPPRLLGSIILYE